MSITITEPGPFSRITNVKCAGTGGGPGVICACGTATDARGPLNGVWAKVVALGTVPTDPHPADAQPGSFDGKAGTWAFLGAQLVPNVPCVAAPSDNTALFVVWCSFKGVADEEHRGANIAARCSSATNCDGTANPCGGRRFVPLGGAPVSAPVETAPRQYQVQGQPGARGPSASLVNRSWVLTLRTAGCSCVWDNGGDGGRLPHVELRCDSVVATTWRLTLRHGDHSAAYSCRAVTWVPLGGNTLTLETPAGTSLPETLTVTPA